MNFKTLSRNTIKIFKDVLQGTGNQYYHPLQERLRLRNLLERHRRRRKRTADQANVQMGVRFFWCGTILLQNNVTAATTRFSLNLTP